MKPGISSVAAAIFDATGAPIAAINVSGHAAHFAGDARRAQIGAGITDAASEISQRLGWHGARNSNGSDHNEPRTAQSDAVWREPSWT